MKKNISVLAFILVFVLLFGACSGRSVSYESAPAASSSTAPAAAPAEEYETAAPADEADYSLDELKSDLADIEAQVAVKGGESGSSTLTGGPEGRKIITTVDIRMESTEYDTCANAILNAIKRAGGYIEYSDVAGSIESPGAKDMAGFGIDLSDFVKPTGGDFESYYRNDRRYMKLKIRVPQSGLSDFISEIEGYGNVLGKQESAEDVTLQYVDIESHKKALALEQERLLAMLAKAESVEDMIKLEERLSQVRYMLEKYESQMRVLDNLINYSTVNLTLDEVLIYTEKPEDPIPKPTVSQRISSGMKETFEDIGNYWVNVFVWFVVNLVYIIGVVAAIVIAFFILRRYYRRINKKDLAGKITTGREKTADKPDGTDGDTKPEE